MLTLRRPGSLAGFCAGEGEEHGHGLRGGGPLPGGGAAPSLEPRPSCPAPARLAEVNHINVLFRLFQQMFERCRAGGRGGATQQPGEEVAGEQLLFPLLPRLPGRQGTAGPHQPHPLHPLAQ